MKRIILLAAAACIASMPLFAQKSFFDKLEQGRVASEKAIVWEQIGPGNAGFANLLRYHPTIPGLVMNCPDMWNAYQSDNNGKSWYGITDSDGQARFMHLRDLSYSQTDADFGLAIGSSLLWETHDRGKHWTIVKDCPWYHKQADGTDRMGWLKKVAAIGIDHNSNDTWYVAGGAFVRGQEWLSSYKTVTAKAPHGLDSKYAGKLWRTQDAGATWEMVNEGLHPKAQIGRIIVHPEDSKLVFAASNYGLYRSKNGGNSWKLIGKKYFDNNIMMDMDFYYNADTGKFVLYVIDQVQYVPDGKTTKCTGGIFRSDNNGKKWTKMNGNLGLDYNRLTGGAPANYYHFIAPWFGINKKQARKLYPELPTNAMQFFSLLSVDPSREGALYIGFADPQIANSIVPGRLWATSDDGKTWESTARLHEHTWKADKDYWEERANPWHCNMQVGHQSDHMQKGKNYALRSMRGLAVGVDGSVMIISDHSTMLSTDHGKTWQQMDETYTPDGNIIGHGNSNLPGLKIGQDKRNEHMVLASGEHCVWIPTNDSPDKRQAMKYISNAQETVSTLAFHPYDSKTIYCTSNRQAKKQYMFRSTDAGYNWKQWGVATPATNRWHDDYYTNGLLIDPINPDYLYFGITDISDKKKAQKDGGFYFSSDNGKTFTQSNEGLPQPSRINDLEFDPRDTSRKSLFAAAQFNEFGYHQPLADGGLYHSTDRGAHWTRIKTPAAVKGINEIIFDQSNRMYITTGYRQGGAGVWYTDDFGKKWHQCFAYKGADLLAISPYDRNLLVVTVKWMSTNPGVYVSRDRGRTWVKSNTGVVTPHRLEDVAFNIHKPGEIWLANLGTGFYKGRITGGDKIQVVDIPTNALDLKLGTDTQAQLQAKIVHPKYTSEKVAWKSDNTSIIKVDKNGTLTVVGKGKTKVWASAKKGRFTDYCVVVVKP